jgi:hypothetical protein
MSIIKNKSVILWLTIICASFLSGCATKPNMYYWGEYEGLIYSMYIEPGTAEPDVQIEKLKNDIQHAQEQSKKTPPGIYAHLGFMYAADGNMALAKDAFIQEKALFPESAKFIDGMMARAFKGDKS